MSQWNPNGLFMVVVWNRGLSGYSTGRISRHMITEFELMTGVEPDHLQSLRITERTAPPRQQPLLQ